MDAATRSWNLVMLEASSYLLYESNVRIMEEQERQCEPAWLGVLVINIPTLHSYW